MVKMKLKIDNDSNKLRYISVLRQKKNLSINEVKRNIEIDNFVLECDYFDTDELKQFKTIVDELINKGAKIHLFQDEREVPTDYINNLITSYKQIEEEREKLDDEILGDD